MDHRKPSKVECYSSGQERSLGRREVLFGSVECGGLELMKGNYRGWEMEDTEDPTSPQEERWQTVTHGLCEVSFKKSQVQKELQNVSGCQSWVITAKMISVLFLRLTVIDFFHVREEGKKHAGWEEWRGQVQSSLWACCKCRTKKPQEGASYSAP